MSKIYPNCNKINEIMSTLGLEKTKLLHPFGIGDDKTAMAINWNDSPSVQRLLDVLSSILAEEYIATAKQNPEVFTNCRMTTLSPLPIPPHKEEEIREKKIIPGGVK